MALADMVWRTHAKYATAIFATACSYGFLYTVVNNSSPLDDARARWAGERVPVKYQLRVASGANTNS